VEDPVSERVYGKAILARLVALAEADPEREVCGFVVGRGEALEVWPVPNVADRYRKLEPDQYPASSRESYLMDPVEQFRIHRELARSGGEIVAIWHSHVEVGAYFSAKDRADALIDGAQVVPAAEYLVLGVKGGRVTEVRRFRFEGGAFLEGEAELALPL
jgi:proteasome lid subunit RPN8/RPN11